MSPHKIWVDQYRATRGIKQRFGTGDALDYLLGEKLLTFALMAERQPEFAVELPRFLSAIWRVFNRYEIAGYLTTLPPTPRRKLRALLYIGNAPSARYSGAAV